LALPAFLHKILNIFFHDVPVEMRAETIIHLTSLCPPTAEEWLSEISGNRSSSVEVYIKSLQMVILTETSCKCFVNWFKTYVHGILSKFSVLRMLNEFNCNSVITLSKDRMQLLILPVNITRLLMFYHWVLKVRQLMFYLLQ